MTIMKEPHSVHGLQGEGNKDVISKEKQSSKDDEHEHNLSHNELFEATDYQNFLFQSKLTFSRNWNIHKKLKDQPLDQTCSLVDFRKWKIIGEGSFAKVYLVSNDKTDKFHAMKVVSKKRIIEQQTLMQSKLEKLVLQCTNYPFLIHLNYFFKDNSYVYFVLPFMQGGELARHLKSSGKFSEPLSMFYLAQVILAIEYLHNLDIVYRDLKPENTLLDKTGYIKLSDFGFCKHLTRGRTYTICGTPEYFAPEVIMNRGYGKSVDWWSVGILAFHLSTGFTPFRDHDREKIYKNILKGTFKIPGFLSENLKNLITNTLHQDVTRRFGNMKNGINDFKGHVWFRPIHWQAILGQKSIPLFIPPVEGPSDCRNFNEIEYKSLIVSDSLEYSEEFADF